MTPHDYVRAIIARWEGNLSMDAGDHGNWYRGQLIGSMHGVTGDVLERHLGRPVTAADIKAVTLDEAADIAVEQFYAPFKRLTWGPATGQLVDFAWGSGVGQAIKSMQRIVGANPDGAMGPETEAKYNAWYAATGEPAAGGRMYHMRSDFYNMLAQRPEYAQYLQGWLNRAAWAAQAWVG